MQLSPRKHPLKITLSNRQSFLKRLSVLMNEGYLLPTALTLLLPMHTKQPSEAIEGMTAILRGGGSAAEILRFLGFKEQVLFPIEIADYHGRLGESITAIADSFSRSELIRKKLKNILVYPVSLLLLTAALFLFFRTSYVPNLTELMSSMQRGEESNAVPAYLLSLPDVFIGCFVLFAVLVAFYKKLLATRSPAVQIRWQLSVPVTKGFVRLYWSQSFARELGTLLHSGVSLQESLELLQKQRYNLTIQHMAGCIRDEVVMGLPLSTAISRHGFFEGDMASFAQQGEAAGYLGKELILYSELLMERIEQRVQALMKVIQPTFFLIIAMCIIGAYLAILLPMYNLVHTI